MARSEKQLKAAITSNLKKVDTQLASLQTTVDDIKTAVEELDALTAKSPETAPKPTAGKKPTTKADKAK